MLTVYLQGCSVCTESLLYCTKVGSCISIELINIIKRRNNQNYYQFYNNFFAQVESLAMGLL